MIDDSLIIFTFHNVSINSQQDMIVKIGLVDLHSIMYLLIRPRKIAGYTVSFIYIP